MPMLWTLMAVNTQNFISNEIIRNMFKTEEFLTLESMVELMELDLFDPSFIAKDQRVLISRET